MREFFGSIAQRVLSSVGILSALLLAILFPVSAHAQGAGFYRNQDVRIDQRLNAQIPLNLPFTDENGRPVVLQQYFTNRPVLLNMIFYRCQGTCTLELNGMVQALRQMRELPGKDFEAVTVSIDPKEGPDLARQKKATYLAMLNRPGAEKGWHFLVGPQSSITALAQAIGFHYRYNAADNTFAHATGIMIATPEGKLSRYFYGAAYAPRDLHLGLVEASDGQIGSPTDQVILLLCHFDPVTGKYAVAITRILQLGGILTVLTIGGMIFLLTRRPRRDPSEAPSNANVS